jgi:uncharacterized protein (DUF58 family)
MSTLDYSNPLIFCQPEALFAFKPFGQKLHLGKPRSSQALMSGNVRARYKGRGMSFAEVRPYQAGDDIRCIDWRVTARTQTPYTKLFEEERERPVFILVDMRSSMFFGSQHQFKCVYAARMAVALAWAACAAGDRIGAMILSDHDEWDLRPKRGKNAVLALIHALVDANRQLSNPAAQSKRSLAQFIEDAHRIIRPGAMVYVITDGHDNQGLTPALCTLSRHADITFMHLYDTLEAHLPNKGWYSVSDGHQRTHVNGKAVSERFHAQFVARQQALIETFSQAMVTGLAAPVSADLEGWLQDTFGKQRRAKHPTTPFNSQVN